MRVGHGIVIDQIIVHIVDVGGNSLVLSERSLPLAGNDRIKSYFTAHIQNSLVDPAAKAARFTNLSDNVATVCRGLLEGTRDLVPASQDLATCLHKVIRGDQRISPGDLAVCLYHVEDTGNPPDSPRHLALLKIDPSEVLRHKTMFDDQKKLYVTFDVETNILPTTRERLQKCAFIQPLAPRPEYDMILLDRQIGPTDDRAIARFFIESYLGATFAFDSRERTQRLYLSLLAAANQLRAELQSDQDDALGKAISGIPSQQHINVDEFLSGLPLTDGQRERIGGVIDAQLPDRDFDIDPTYAASLLQRCIFRGDFGLRVEVRTDKYSQVVQSVDRIDGPDRPPYYRVVLHTEQWDRVPGKPLQPSPAPPNRQTDSR